MPTVTLDAGTIHYETAGPSDGRPVVFIHGYLMGSSLWRPLGERLAARGCSCVAPTWPLGAHTEPMRDGVELTVEGIAAMVGELLDALALEDVVLVGNDTGGAIAQFRRHERTPTTGLVRWCLTSCDAFEHFPPPILKPLIAAAKAGPAYDAALQPLRTRFGRNRGFGDLAHADIDDLVAAWVKPVLTNRRIRKDLRRLTASLEPGDDGPGRSAPAELHQFIAGRVVRRRRVLPARGWSAAGGGPTQLSARGHREREDVLDDRPTRPARRPYRRLRPDCANERAA